MSRQRRHSNTLPYSHFVSVGVIGQIGGLSGLGVLAALGLITDPEVLREVKVESHSFILILLFTWSVKLNWSETGFKCGQE